MRRRIRSIRVLDGADVLIFGLRHAIVAPRWRVWLAERLFSAGGRVLGSGRIELQGSSANDPG